MEASILHPERNLVSKFLQCQRCKRFILSETSTAKRIHNVRCLSYLIDEGTRTGECAWEVFQGFVTKCFPTTTVALTKLTDQEINLRSTAKKRERNGRSNASSRLGTPEESETKLEAGNSRNHGSIKKVSYNLDLRKNGHNVKTHIMKRSRVETKPVADLANKGENGNDLTNHSSETGEIRYSWERGRKPGVGNRDGIDMNNIIEQKTSRKSCLKAKAKFQESSDDDDDKQTEEDSEDDTVKKDLIRKRKRKQKFRCGSTEDKNMKSTEEILNSEKVNLRSFNKVTCAVCKGRIVEDFLEMHMNHFHSEGHNQASCDCNIRFCNAIDLENEIGSAKITCNKCGRKILRRGMSKHLLLHERGELVGRRVVGNILCAVCKEGVSSYSSLKGHFIAFHMKNSPFVCKFPGCNYKGGDYYHLERHVASHLRKAKLQCPQCGAPFAKLGSLIKHRQFVCKMKGKSNKKVYKQFVNKSTKPTGNTEITSPTENTSNVDMKSEAFIKTELIINVGSIHLHDRILETEDGEAIHLKGESLDILEHKTEVDAPLEIPPFGSSIHSKDKNVSLSQDKSNDDEHAIGVKWDESKVREAALKMITEWNDKLQDVGYINSTIQQDPFFQKLVKENEEFTKMVLRGGGRNNYFSVHKSATKFMHRCDICSQAFRRGWALLKHKKDKVCQFLVEDNKQSTIKEAPITGTSSPSSSTNVEKQEMDFMCSSCGLKSESALEMEEHMKIHNKGWWEGREHKCPKNCGAWFKTVKQLFKHLDEVHIKERTVKCLLCPKTFVNKTRMQMHMSNFHKKGFQFKCKRCNRGFKTKAVYEEHTKVCNIEAIRPKCQQCNEHFCNRTSLRRHIALVHAGIGAKQNEHDNKTIRNLNNLRTTGNLTSESDPLSQDDFAILGI